MIARGLLELVVGDITREGSDAIVNAANTGLRGGGGVDGAIHSAGGPKILAECAEKYPRGIRTGEAVITGGGDLTARFVIHAVGPVWRGGKSGEAEKLRSAYESSLARAKEAGARRISFPSISTGAYGYPLPEASRVALETCIHCLENDPGSINHIRFVLFNETTFRAYARSLDALLRGAD
ncbi:O-acetyl-ADP-ribose deacetylase [bacterium]|nr:O-acetyl-ADP-ribose deacetylase [bacterium]